MKTLLAAIYCLALLNAPSQAQQPDFAPSARDIRPLLLGDKAPEITLLSPAQEPHTLTQLAGGQPVALIFYRGGW